MAGLNLLEVVYLYPEDYAVGYSQSEKTDKDWLLWLITIIGSNPIGLTLWRCVGIQFLCVFLLLAWECLDERWSRFDAFDWSSVLVSFVTRFQVSCGDSSPSSLHLRLERWCADMMIWTSWENLVEVAVLPLAFDHLVNRRNNEERSIGYKEFLKCSWLTLSFQDLVLSATIVRV